MFKKPLEGYPTSPLRTGRVNVLEGTLLGQSFCNADDRNLDFCIK